MLVLVDLPSRGADVRMASTRRSKKKDATPSGRYDLLFDAAQSLDESHSFCLCFFVSEPPGGTRAFHASTMSVQPATAVSGEAHESRLPHPRASLPGPKNIKFKPASDALAKSRSRLWDTVYCKDSWEDWLWSSLPGALRGGSQGASGRLSLQTVSLTEQRVATAQTLQLLLCAEPH